MSTYCVRMHICVRTTFRFQKRPVLLIYLYIQTYKLKNINSRYFATFPGIFV